MSTGLLWVCFHVVSILSHIDYSLVLHQQMKLKYFQQHRWSEAWIDTAEEIVGRNLLSTKYLRQLPLLVYIISIHFASLANILTLHRPSQVTIEMSLTSLIFLWTGFRKAMNWTNIYLKVLKRSGTPSHGGGITRRFTHGSRQWHSITLVFQVCVN